MGNNGAKKGIEPPPMAQPNAEQSSMSMRLRLVEEKSNNLNKKIEFLERNMVAVNKKKSDMLHNFDSELLDLKREIDSLKQKTDLIIRELKLSAGKDELNTIKRYLDLWNLARFVTREEVERIVEESMGKTVVAPKAEELVGDKDL